MHGDAPRTESGPPSPASMPPCTEPLRVQSVGRDGLVAAAPRCFCGILAARTGREGNGGALGEPIACARTNNRGSRPLITADKHSHTRNQTSAQKHPLCMPQLHTRTLYSSCEIPWVNPETPTQSRCHRPQAHPRLCLRRLQRLSQRCRCQQTRRRPPPPPLPPPFPAPSPRCMPRSLFLFFRVSFPDRVTTLGRDARARRAGSAATSATGCTGIRA